MRTSDNPALAALLADKNVGGKFKAALPTDPPAPVTSSAYIRALHKQVVDIALAEPNFFVRNELQQVEVILYRLAHTLAGPG